MIGLLTPFMVNNYGTKLQAYAVQQSIHELGLEAEIINCPAHNEKTTLANVPRKCFNRLIQMKYKDRRNVVSGSAEVEACRRRRAQAINAFDSEYLRLSEPLEGRHALIAYGAACSAVLCGSDQIWNPYNIGANFYMLEWVGAATAKIAYSPSFGVERLPAVLRRKYVRELRTFKALSVREESGRRELERLGFPQAVWTLDPTMMVSMEQWNMLAEKGRPYTQGGSVFCYLLGGMPLGRQAARMLAEKNGLRVAAMPHLTGYAEADERWKADDILFDAGVPEFLRLIRDADFVVTDSFHAAVFSVLFHKAFCVVHRHDGQKHSTNTRLESLLKMLKLEQRLCTAAEDVLQQMEQSIDYCCVDQLLEQEREKTKQYLIKSLFS